MAIISGHIFYIISYRPNFKTIDHETRRWTLYLGGYRLTRSSLWHHCHTELIHLVEPTFPALPGISSMLLPRLLYKLLRSPTTRGMQTAAVCPEIYGKPGRQALPGKPRPSG